MSAAYRAGVRIGEQYRAGRERVLTLAADITDDQAAAPVPACPEWRVKDVYAHLSGVVADILAGQLDGVATDPWTARQVAERADWSLGEICTEWTTNACTLEAMLATVDDDLVDPRLVIDEWTHEQDIRGALGRPGARDLPVVAFAVRHLAAGIGEYWKEAGLAPVGLAGDTASYVLGDGEPVATLRAPDFELARLLLGRRSTAQVTALDWTADPGPAVDHLHVFGPATADVVE